MLPELLPAVPLDDPFFEVYSSFIIWVLITSTSILAFWIYSLIKAKAKTEHENINLLIQSLNITITEQQTSFAIQHTALAESLAKLDTTLSTLNNTVNTLSHDVDQRFHALELEMELHKVRCQSIHADNNIGLNI